MNISIVDDELLYCNQLETFLKEWSVKNEIQINIFSYDNGNSLLADNYGQNYLIFLDIDMPEINGMEVAKKLRKNGYKSHIIFLTAHNEYVYEGYHVRALDYLLKPITLEKLESCLSPVLEELKSSVYIFRTATCIEKIPYSSIIAFATQGHYIDIITEQHTYHQKISLKTIKQILPENFEQCHRTLMVNINHITKLDGNNLHLTNQEIFPISKQYLKNIQNAFISCTL